MKPKTCEEYVLAELENANYKIETLGYENVTLIGKTVSLTEENSRLKAENEEIKDLLVTFASMYTIKPNTYNETIMQYVTKSIVSDCDEEFDELDRAYKYAKALIGEESDDDVL